MARRRAVLNCVFAALALLGILLSVYLLSEHYAPGASSFCDISATVSCDVVNKSPYAEIFGIPISALGILFYLAVLAYALAPERLARVVADGDRELLSTFFLVWLIFGFGFSLYLTFIEGFILHVFCPLCVLSAAIVTFLLAATALTWRS